MTTKGDSIKVSILKALQDAEEPIGASRIAERLYSMGLAIRPRTVRFYLLQLDRDGLTQRVSRRRGRTLTERGREELARANVLEKIGFVAAKVDTLGYRMNFCLRKGEGTIISNVGIIHKRDLGRALWAMKPVFEAKLAMGDRLFLAKEGEKIGGFVVPKDTVGIATVCSVTLNGILLSERIPVTSRFGGLVEIRNRQPVRFVELIEYSGTTLDPLEAYIRAGMTQAAECARTGTGIIGASFREVPSAALDVVRRLHRMMEQRGLGGILAIGKPNRPLMEIPVADGRAGLVVIGGLNPVAAVHEAGIRVGLRSLAGLADYSLFLCFREIVAMAPKRRVFPE